MTKSDAPESEKLSTHLDGITWKSLNFDGIDDYIGIYSPVLCPNCQNPLTLSLDGDRYTQCKHCAWGLYGEDEEHNHD
ncbi:MAG: hypothetical protein GTO60_16585 [Gammaproteobacteria bacterium]|nr:hypothetical protein [Gammaproteobacteria bacterium]